MAGAIYVNDGTPVTGSFSKITITSADLPDGSAGAQFDDIQFGIGDLSKDDGTNNHLSPCHIHNVISDMPVTGSITIEGPIVGFHLTDGAVIAYRS